ncbi:hypothetical protein D1007_27725 [Hordeum vulgare]|uniref:Late embryogenesis abundant protein LEA-2 subgroup domain-containing protein n=1 Tax=Hordeum vulgare subsp. vulgare TaxID=112509 RepID=A0A8I6Y1Q4_HORVV|nr:uncharacterized protein LOC123399596 [Hordeum vulgare subsp. vulgare]KAE8797168.1 hypothetical protein D1007_27725 [Hordeum vulgare]
MSMDLVMTSRSRRRGGYGCKESCHGHCLPPHSVKCLCLYLLLSLILLVIVAAVLLVVFVTRLKKPTFYLQSVQMDRSFSLRSSSSNRSGDNATSSCSVASLLFAAQNPNGLGIRYSAADLGVAYANESVGAMDVPVFYQPPRSSNVTVLMHAVFEESNVSRLVVSELSAQRKLVEIRIAGSIDATTHIMNFPLPKLQFTLDCRIATNYTDIVLREGIESATIRKEIQVSALPHISQKCSIKLDMRSRGKRTRLADLGC